MHRVITITIETDQWDDRRGDSIVEQIHWLLESDEDTRRYLGPWHTIKCGKSVAMSSRHRAVCDDGEGDA